MIRRRFSAVCAGWTRRALALGLLLLPSLAAGKCCVWKVTSPQATLYIAGSVHALSKSDYPLPAPYDQALAASSELYFETDPHAAGDAWDKELSRAAALPGKVTFKDKVDPRTYAYIQAVLRRTEGSTQPEKKIEHLRPWVLGWMLESPGGTAEITGSYGVEAYLTSRAAKTGKRTFGLVNLREHIAVFGGMSDEDSETFLLLQFIHLDSANAEFGRLRAAWHAGDTGTIDRIMRDDYKDSPSLYRRIVTDRNRRWLPKLEGFLRDGSRTRLIVAGAAHSSGGEGLPALLRAHGYRVEQL